jgi:hypothetical protein
LSRTVFDTIDGGRDQTCRRRLRIVYALRALRV